MSIPQFNFTEIENECKPSTLLLYTDKGVLFTHGLISGVSVTENDVVKFQLTPGDYRYMVTTDKVAYFAVSHSHSSSIYALAKPCTKASKGNLLTIHGTPSKAPVVSKSTSKAPTPKKPSPASASSSVSEAEVDRTKARKEAQERKDAKTKAEWLAKHEKKEKAEQEKFEKQKKKVIADANADRASKNKKEKMDKAAKEKGATAPTEDSVAKSSLTTTTSTKSKPSSKDYNSMSQDALKALLSSLIVPEQTEDDDVFKDALDGTSVEEEDEEIEEQVEEQDTEGREMDGTFSICSEEFFQTLDEEQQDVFQSLFDNVTFRASAIEKYQELKAKASRQ